MQRILLATVTLIALSSSAFAQSSGAPSPGTNPTGSGTPGPAVPGSAATTPMPPGSSIQFSNPRGATVAPQSITPAVTGSSTSIFATISPEEDLTSSVVGLDVYNGRNEKIGTIKDLAMKGGQVDAFIIGVGGFLGMGDRYVAVLPQALILRYHTDDKKWHATMNVDADALKAAPEYKYQT